MISSSQKDNLKVILLFLIYDEKGKIAKAIFRDDKLCLSSHDDLIAKAMRSSW